MASAADNDTSFFSLLSRLGEIHDMVVKLDKYPRFLSKYISLNLLRLAAAMSFLVLGFLFRNDPLESDNISTRQYAIFAVVGVLNIIGRMSPFMARLAIDQLKESLQAMQATSCVRKIFELPHNAMLSTPTGEFAQLMSKVFRNLDSVLPALYGAIIPIFVEVLIAVVFIGTIWGPIALILFAFFIVFSVVSYYGAGKKVERDKNLMMAMLSEWGKILTVAGSYERAHFFDNVEYEVGVAHKCFTTIGSKMKNG